MVTGPRMTVDALTRLRDRAAHDRATHGVGEYFAANGLGEFFVPLTGMGEYFAANGLGADALTTSDAPNAGGVAYMAGLGALAGLALVGLTQSKRRLAGAGTGRSPGQ